MSTAAHDSIETPQEATMPYQVDDVRIREIKELAPPSHLLREFPHAASRPSALAYDARRAHPSHPARAATTA